MLDQLKADLRRDEGFRKSVYQDSRGFWTIGYGFLVDGRLNAGIPKDIAEIWLDSLIADRLEELDRNIPWWRDLPEPARLGLANMAYQMGWPKLSKFKKTLLALRQKDWDKAAAEALDSDWAKQTPKRAERASELFLSCNIEEAAAGPQDTSSHWWPLW